MKFFTLVVSVFGIGLVQASSVEAGHAKAVAPLFSNGTVPVPACLLACIGKITRENEGICGSSSNVSCFCNSLASAHKNTTVKQEVTSCFGTACNKKDGSFVRAGQFFEGTCNAHAEGKLGNGTIKAVTRLPPGASSSTVAEVTILPWTPSSTAKLHVRDDSSASSEPSGESSSPPSEPPSSSEAPPTTQGESATEVAITTTIVITSTPDVPEEGASSASETSSAVVSTTSSDNYDIAGVVVEPTGSESNSTASAPDTSTGFATLTDTGASNGTETSVSSTGASSNETTEATSSIEANSTLATAHSSGSETSSASEGSNSTEAHSTSFAPLNTAGQMLGPSLITFGIAVGIAILI